MAPTRWEPLRYSSIPTTQRDAYQTVQVEKVRGPELAVRRNGAGWTQALAELAPALDRGRVYDRDLRALAQQLQQVITSLDQRPAWSRQIR